MNVREAIGLLRDRGWDEIVNESLPDDTIRAVRCVLEVANTAVELGETKVDPDVDPESLDSLRAFRAGYAIGRIGETGPEDPETGDPDDREYLPPLYRLGREMAYLVDVLDETGGELTPELEEFYDEVGGDFDARVERDLLYAESQDRNAAAVGAEIDRLSALRTRYEKRAAAIREIVRRAMERAGIVEAGGPLAPAKLVHKAPSIADPDDSEDIPPAFRRVSVGSLDGSTYEALADTLEEAGVTVRIALNKTAAMEAAKIDEAVPPKEEYERRLEAGDGRGTAGRIEWNYRGVRIVRERRLKVG